MDVPETLIKVLNLKCQSNNMVYWELGRHLKCVSLKKGFGRGCRKVLPWISWVKPILKEWGLFYLRLTEKYDS